MTGTRFYPTRAQADVDVDTMAGWPNPRVEPWDTDYPHDYDDAHWEAGGGWLIAVGEHGAVVLDDEQVGIPYA